MSNSKKTVQKRVSDKNNPIWTDKDFKAAKRFSELPKEMQKGLMAITRKGRPRLQNPKKLITLRLDAALVDHLRKKSGYNKQVEAVLVKAREERVL